MFEAIYYTVQSLDGDYANLIKDGDDTAEPKVVARALLPSEIAEGSRVKYEMMQYSME